MGIEGAVEIGKALLKLLMVFKVLFVCGCDCGSDGGGGTEVVAVIGI